MFGYCKGHLSGNTISGYILSDRLLGILLYQKSPDMCKVHKAITLGISSKVSYRVLTARV